MTTYSQDSGRAAEPGSQVVYRTRQDRNGVWWRRYEDGTCWYFDNGQWVECPSSADISQGVNNDPYASQPYYPVHYDNNTPAYLGEIEDQSQYDQEPVSPTSTMATSGSYAPLPSHGHPGRTTRRRRQSIDGYVESTRRQADYATTWRPMDTVHALAAIQEHSIASRPIDTNPVPSADLDISDEAETDNRSGTRRRSSSGRSRKEHGRSSRHR